MTTLVTFCVFGRDEEDIYYGGAVANADAYSKHHPDWKLRFYLGDTPFKSDLPKRLTEFWNVEVIYHPGPEDQTATAWRFDALRDWESYDFFLFRDTDSRPIRRERVAVAEWMTHPQLFHVMRDHPRHGAVILSGLFDVRKDGARQIAQHVPAKLHYDHYGVDQAWLQGTLWRYVKRSVLAHVDCKWHYRMSYLPFQVPRTEEGFVGEGFFADGSRRYPEHLMELPEYVSSPHAGKVLDPRVRADLRRTPQA